MNIFSLPSELPAPEVDYRNYNASVEAAMEQKHQKQLKNWLIEHGYNKPLTGEILREPHGDGHALYMVADAGHQWGLMHLPYGDAYHSPNVEFLPKSEVKKRILREKERASLFKNRK